MNTNTFHNLSYGVYIISSLDGSRSTGCVVNSVMQITSSPATIAVSINHDNFTNRPDLCEYQCNGAMAAAKAYKKAPIMIANDVVEV